MNAAQEGLADFLAGRLTIWRARATSLLKNIIGVCLSERSEDSCPEMPGNARFLVGRHGALLGMTRQSSAKFFNKLPE